MFNKEDGTRVVGKSKGQKREAYVFQGEVQTIAGTALLAILLLIGRRIVPY